jgi:hypothetical protein
MDTTLYEGPAALDWLHGGDIAFLVGFVVGGAVYAVLQWPEIHRTRELERNGSTLDSNGHNALSYQEMEATTVFVSPELEGHEKSL